MTKIALVDDHTLLRNGLASVINSFGNYEVIFEAGNGIEFIEKLKIGEPEILLLDITMPEMDGFETAKWIKENRPEIKVLVLSMSDDDHAVIKMLQLGAKGYILKDSRPEILKHALREILEKDFYFNDLVSGKLVHLVRKGEDQDNRVESFSEKELTFLKWCCTEKSYKEIADAMQISTRAVETLRSNLFVKLETLSRVGLVMYAIKHKIVQV